MTLIDCDTDAVKLVLEDMAKFMSDGRAKLAAAYNEALIRVIERHGIGGVSIAYNYKVDGFVGYAVAYLDMKEETFNY